MRSGAQVPGKWLGRETYDSENNIGDTEASSSDRRSIVFLFLSFCSCDVAQTHSDRDFLTSFFGFWTQRRCLLSPWVFEKCLKDFWDALLGPKGIFEVWVLDAAYNWWYARWSCIDSIDFWVLKKGLLVRRTKKSYWTTFWAAMYFLLSLYWISLLRFLASFCAIWIDLLIAAEYKSSITR